MRKALEANGPVLRFGQSAAEVVAEGQRSNASLFFNGGSSKRLQMVFCDTTLDKSVIVVLFQQRETH